MLDVFLDAVLDSFKILPFLFITYLVMEYLESHTEDKVHDVVRRAGRMGPLWGGLLGVVPQCGFSAAASNLYAGRAITLGTLIAIFLVTSDEMLPIMISESVPISRMLKILLVKLAIGILCGFVIDFLHRRKNQSSSQRDDEDFLIERLCEKEHCHCKNGSIVLSALKHTLHILLFVFLITILLNFAFLFIGEARLTSFVSSHPVSGLLVSALVGLIPNCGASVLLTQMYLHGVLPASHMIAGLLDGAGVGLLILFRVNPEQRENIRITILLYLVSVAFGIMIHVLRISF